MPTCTCPSHLVAIGLVAVGLWLAVGAALLLRLYRWGWPRPGADKHP
jgi:hypothetical protein